MRILYFDINGTLTVGTTDRAKEKLAGGKFEEAVRKAKFQKLVCVSTMVGVVEAYHAAGREVDGHKFIFQACGGTVQDLDWFRHISVLEPKYRDRVNVIEADQDWWYMDDYAQEYLDHSNRRDILPQAVERIFAPDSRGDGTDVLDWLAAIPAPPA